MQESASSRSLTVMGFDAQAERRRLMSHATTYCAKRKATLMLCSARLLRATSMARR